MPSFAERLHAASQKADSLLCVGLDPDPQLMPVKDVAAFQRAIIEATHDLACAFKPNLAFYEALGAEGHQLLRQAVDLIHAHGVLAIGDAKRGDVEHTARFHAKALVDEYNFDAVTVNPYLGRDSLRPFLEREGRGVFVLCRTSNPGAADLQSLLCLYAGETRPLYQVVALKAKEWDEGGNVGLVVGATQPEELRQVRALCPSLPLLVPGVGAQGGDLEQAVRYGVDAHGGGLLVNTSRQVLYASKGTDYAEAARSVAQEVRGRINRVRSTLT